MKLSAAPRPKTAELKQRQSLRSAQRTRAKCGQFAAQIGLAERPKGDVQPREARKNIQQFDFGARAAEDEMRMLVGRRDERVTGGLNGRVAGLNGLLWERKIGANKDVNVSGLAICRLREAGITHKSFWSKWQEFFLGAQKVQGPCRR